MRYLLIDNSNTRTKFTIGTATELEAWLVRVPTAELSHQLLDSILLEKKFDAVMLCSVVPQKAELMAEYFSDYPFHQLSHVTEMGIRIDYPKPEQIGADRLANSVGVHYLYGSPAIVIDFGTAVTFDAVGANATYLGGVIAPGLAAMTDYLSRRTALLPKIELSEPSQAIGKSTTQAMHAGAVFGYRGLVREIIQQISSEMPDKPIIVATGGDAELISRELPEIQHFSPTLTLEGIRLAAAQHFPTF